MSPVWEMPLHLISLILCGLDNIQSLGSAILSHSSMYAAFEENPHTILFRILSSQIPSNLIVHAANAYDATQDDNQSKQKLWNMSSRAWNRWEFDADDYLWRGVDDHKSGPAFAASLSKTHMLVEHFTGRYLGDTLPLAARELIFGRGQADGAHTICIFKNEVYRIRRALYRFQFYCNIICVRDKHPDSCGQQSKRDRRYRGHMFFIHSPPWVNEQLACIHDYLERVLSRAFDDVAAHDVGWGANSVDWVSRGKDNKYKQAYLSYGLQFLAEVDRADTYDERLRLLTSKGMPYTSRGLATDLVEKGPPIDDFYVQWVQALGLWSSDQFEGVFRMELNEADDYDSSPFNVWLHTHRHRFAEYSVFVPEYCRLRLCGYVFWDAPEPGPRRNASQKGLRMAKRQGRIDMKEPEGLREEMERSWAERAEVLRNGGHGYWTRGDLSKVVWDDGGKPLESAEVAEAVEVSSS